MYRPQFVYPLAPSPCMDQTCMYSFDSTNCPVFAGTLTAGNRTPRIPLKLDKDADFYLRAIDTQGTVSLRIEDADGNPLFDSENATASTNYAHPHKYSFTNGAGFVALEGGPEGIPARAGGNYLVYLYNQTASSINLTTCALNLVGVKRYGSEVCK
jgi:hypothetical protein